MADVPPYPEPDDESHGETDIRPGRGSTHNTPRWVYVFGIIAIVMVVLFVVLHLTGGGFRGHMP